MKKVAGLVLAALLVSNLSACTNRYTTPRNNTTNINKGTTQGTRTGYGVPNTGTTQGVNQRFRDGVYTGIGDAGTQGNQTATITITNGKITNVDLETVNPQGTTTGTNGTTITPGARTYGTPGATTGGMAGGMTGTYPNTTQGNTGYATGNNVGSYGYNNGNGYNNGATNNGAGRTYGYAGNTNSTVNKGTTNGYADYDRIRRDIASAIISRQNFDINLGQNDGNSLARNWRLASQRALDKARTGVSPSVTSPIGSAESTNGGEKR